MTERVLVLDDILQPDRLATQITDKWIEWDSMRQLKKNDWEEIKRYVYATDTTSTSNSQLPWKNKTTIPKLCQIRDNLYANYTATLFPQRKWLVWESNTEDAGSVEKSSAISNYMSWVIEQPNFKEELDKVILDFIDYGNCFATVQWIDERVQQPGVTQTGFIGPCLQRISPLDIVMNPTSESFLKSPKIVKSLINVGELKDLLEKHTNDQNREEYEELYNYLKDIRSNVTSFEGDVQQLNNSYQVDGFTSFQQYLSSDTCEVLTFYGDIYDTATGEFIKNHVITVVDRHKLIGKKPNPSFFGYPPIFHCSWRKKQDNLWGMGPLDNLIGLQYRLDHLENMKSDIVDLVTYPVQKIKGSVEDFTWQPGEKIWVSEEGDVELVVPNVEPLRIDSAIAMIMQLMEEIAGAPKEAMGFRTPGEKTKYEVQRMENAASRVFQNKIKQFEEQLVEPALNAELELARRNLTGSTVVSVFDDELKVASFQALTVDDITGSGRIKPIAARHFAEQAQLVQDFNALSTSPIWQSIIPHVSTVRLAQMMENILGVQQYKVFVPWVGMSEQVEAQKMQQALQEQAQMAAGTATGQGDDFDMEVEQQQAMEAGQQAMMMQEQG